MTVQTTLYKSCRQSSMEAILSSISVSQSGVEAACSYISVLQSGVEIDNLILILTVV